MDHSLLKLGLLATGSYLCTSGAFLWNLGVVQVIIGKQINPMNREGRERAQYQTDPLFAKRCYPAVSDTSDLKDSNQCSSTYGTRSAGMENG